MQSSILAIHLAASLFQFAFRESHPKKQCSHENKKTVITFNDTTAKSHIKWFTKIKKL